MRAIVVLVTQSLKWACKLAALFLLELLFGVAFYCSAIAGAMYAAYLAWQFVGWPFVRIWEGEIAVVAMISGAVIGGGGWLLLRYKVIQPAMRWIGLAKRPKALQLFGLKLAV